MTHALRIILLLFLLLATLYNLCVPLGEGPDESGHMEYVLFLAREGRLPVQGSSAETSDVPGEGHQPPLAYLLALPAVFWLPADAPTFEQTANPAFLWNGGDQPAAYMRASREYWPWRGVVLGWHLARGISTLLGACAVFCTWGAARAISASTNPHHREAIALLAAVLVAFNPQFLFTSALVTNDVLLTTLSAALLWVCVFPSAPLSPLWERGSRASDGGEGESMHPTLRMLLAGLLLGLALLTKQNALLLAVLPLWASWRSARDERGWSMRRFALLVACWSAVVLLVAGWWYVRNWQIYGDPLGMQAFRAQFLTQPFEWQRIAAWISALERLHASFWAYFGWVSLPAPAPVIWCYTVLEVAALVGLVRLVRRSRRGSGTARVWTRSVWLPLVLLLVLAFVWTVSFALTAGLVAWQGRLLFVALPVVAILLAHGLWAVGQGVGSAGQRVRRYGVVVFGVLLVLLAAWLPTGFIAPSYTWHTLPPEAARAQVGIPVYARYAKPWEQGTELRGWRLEREGSSMAPLSDETHMEALGMETLAVREVTAGETVSLTLTWHCLERIEHNWTVFIHLVDAEGQIVAEDNSIPQHGNFPMPLWTPGDWLHDTHILALPTDLAPGEYVLRVGLYLPWQRDPQSGRRQDTWAEDGTDIGDFAEIGILRIRQDTSLETVRHGADVCSVRTRLHAGPMHRTVLFQEGVLE